MNRSWRIMPAAIGLALLCLETVAAPASQARAAREDIVVSDIKLQFVSTPLVNYTNINNTQRNSTRNKWVAFETVFVPQSGNKEWLDDVTMEGTLVINSETSTTQSSGEKEALYIVLTGKTRFLTIPADGDDHQGLLLVPPKLMDRYYVKGKPFSTSMILAARIQFFGAGRVLLGEGYWYNGGFVKRNADLAKVRNLMREFEKNYSDIVRIPGGLYSKEKTPWALYNYDFYDLIYEESAGKDSRR